MKVFFLVAPISGLLLTVIGALVALVLFLLLTKSLASALFWGILLGASMGNSLVNMVILVASGDLEGAGYTLRYIPFFLAALDESFFSVDVAEMLFVCIGLALLFVWVYVLGYYATKYFGGIWGLPTILPIVYISGLTLPNLRWRLATWIPLLEPLLAYSNGVLLFVLLETPIVLLVIFLHRRGYKAELPLPRELTIESD